MTFEQPLAVFNPSPPVLIYSRQSQNVQLFDPSGSTCGKSVKYRNIEFFIFHYDSLPISFQSGITFFL